MKMLAFLGGELSNSATYFSTFADVSKKDITNCNGTFCPGASSTWKKWKLFPCATCKRVKDDKAVEKFKKKAESSTTFNANQHSRQEFTPLVDNIIGKAHLEPLHLKNNAYALAHHLLVNIAISWFKLTVTSFSKVSPHCLF